MIAASVDLLAGEPILFDSSILNSSMVPRSTTDPACTTEERIFPRSVAAAFATNGIWQGCQVAAKASRKLKWHYAVIKYAFSHSLYATAVLDLEPNHAVYLPISKFPEKHVRLAHAIVAAYSAREDLGLEMQLKPGQQSRQNGKWNPDVLDSLETRLRAAGIDASDPVVWALRGPSRRLDKRRPIPSRGKHRWSSGWIRDCKVVLLDAIAHVSWFRSKKELTPSLSPYDVANAQHLARRVILEALGFWKAWPAEGAARRVQPR